MSGLGVAVPRLACLGLVLLVGMAFPFEVAGPDTLGNQNPKPQALNKPNFEPVF